MRFVLTVRPCRALLRLLTACGIAATLTTPSSASFPPKRFKASKEDVAGRCEALGPRASYTAWSYKPGEYGCVDTKSGFILICQEADESCKLYYPPRRPAPKPADSEDRAVKRQDRAVSTPQNGRRAPDWLSATLRRSDA